MLPVTYTRRPVSRTRVQVGSRATSPLLVEHPSQHHARSSPLDHAAERRRTRGTITARIPSALLLLATIAACDRAGTNTTADVISTLPAAAPPAGTVSSLEL